MGWNRWRRGLVDVRGVRLETASCRERFGRSRVARLATTGRNGPGLVPIVFVLIGDRIVTAVDHKPKRTRRLARLDNITANPEVTALVDHYTEDWSTLWWVRAEGTARVIERGSVADEDSAALIARYPQYRNDPPPGPFIEITVARWIGWTAA